ncbi:hypothetical protein [Pseudarthrobacter sp. J47]|uniref:hypothetical protein n=1 Tax=Pseudarthrobacter sp. J47 TaxID=3116482 RepID=UPI002E81E321|nr:hypothetical protein [Pseudarthrobacter sp. J47]MEE2524531.1 hypothetical protein [Pseudarthrobacter sp. J47]
MLTKITTAREILTTDQRVRAAAGNYLAATRDTSKENHSIKHWTEATPSLCSADVAKVTEVERSMTFIDAATNRLYKPCTLPQK